MPERTGYANGVPTWVDVATPDVASSVAFYSGLFGWEHVGATVDEYGMFTLRGKLVAGIGQLQEDDQPAVWTTYLAADDADATIAAATAAGGQVVMAAIDIPDAGRMAILQDGDGAFVGIWQARGHRGAQLVNEPGTLGWNELATRDMDAALAFYTSVFDYEPYAMPSDTVNYSVLDIDGKAVAGVLQMDEHWPDAIPPHWMVYFVVADADESAALATQLGGHVQVQPFDAPPLGRIAVLSDPAGTHFSIIALANPPD